LLLLFLWDELMPACTLFIVAGVIVRSGWLLLSSSLLLLWTVLVSGCKLSLLTLFGVVVGSSTVWMLLLQSELFVVFWIPFVPLLFDASDVSAYCGNGAHRHLTE
jgi:hypothetical protein